MTDVFGVYGCIEADNLAARWIKNLISLNQDGYNRTNLRSDRYWIAEALWAPMAMGW